jgi:hypothetical protein
MTMTQFKSGANSEFRLESLTALQDQESSLTILQVDRGLSAPGSANLSDSAMKAAVKKTIRDYGDTLRRLASE